MNVARFSPNGKYIAGASGHNAFLKLYELDRESLSVIELATGDFHIHSINDIAWSPCGQYIATGGEDCVIVIWRLHVNEKNRRIQLEPRRVFRGHAAAVTALSFNYKGTMLASGSVDEKIIVWNVKGGTLLKLLNAHSRPIVSVDFSYDSKLLLTASHDGYLRIWSLVDGMALRILSGAEELLPICSAKFSPNSAYALVTYTGGLTRLLNLASKAVEKQYELPDRYTHINGLGSQLLSTENDKKEENLPSLNMSGGAGGAGGAGGGDLTGVYGNSSTLNSDMLDLYTRELAFCSPNQVLVGTPSGIAVYDLKTQELKAMLTDVPTLCIDINEPFRVGLSAGPTGLKLFNLNFSSS